MKLYTGAKEITSDKLNSNIGCFEIGQTVTIYERDDELNSNIGCFEIEKP